MRTKSELWDKSDIAPIRLKERLREAGKSQQDLANLVTNKRGRPVARSLICGVCTRGYIPPDVPDFKAQVEAALEGWGVSTHAVWEPEEGKGNLRRKPKKTSGPARGGGSGNGANKGGDEEMNITREFLTDEEIRHFGLTDDPFCEISDFSDIYVSPQLKVVERRFLDTIKRHGIMAIVGDAGAGKSTLLRYMLTKLMKDNRVRIIMPDDMDREKLTGRGLTSSIIASMGSGHSPRSAVERDRMAKRLLEDAIRQGTNPVLIIDEAHDLQDQVLIALKRIWDSGLIFRYISIIIVGQGGRDEKGYSYKLRDVLENNGEIREFAERCYLVDMGEIGTPIPEYLAYRFKRAGADAHKIFSPDAMALLSKRSGVPNRAHNLAVRAMRAAYRDGRAVVETNHVNDV